MVERLVNPAESGATAPVEVELVRMTHQHVQQVMEIEEATFRPSWTEISFHVLIDRGCDCWVLTAGQATLGYAVCQVEGVLAHILNLCVDEKCRGRGYGRRLLLHVLQQLPPEVEYAVLEVRRSNQSALNLYVSSGFQKKSVKPGYYPTENGREDAIVLIKPLG